ncbi:hypothetical protein D3C78_576880 [compost metagenome]
MARPAHDERRPQAGFHGGEVGAAPGTVGALPRMRGFAAVVAGEDHQGVVLHTGGLQGIENLAGAMVHFGKGIGPGPIAGLADEFRVRQRRHVHQGEGNVRQEGFAGLRIALDEGRGPLGDLGVQRALAGEVELLDLARGFPLACLVDVLRRRKLLVPALLAAKGRRHAVALVGVGPHHLIVGTWHAIPFIEALVGGEARFAAAQVPLAPDPGGISLPGQQLREGDLPQRQTIRRIAVGYPVGSGADRETPGHQRRTGRSALRLDVEIGQAHAFGGQLVDARRFGTAQHTAAIGSQFAVAEVVVQHDDDVRRGRRRAGEWCRQQSAQECQARQTGFHEISSGCYRAMGKG